MNATGLFQGTVYWELTVKYYPECDEFESVHLEQSPLTRNRLYASLWMFWFRNIFQVFVPFFVLLGLNGAIIHRMRHAPDMEGALMSVAIGARRAKERKASRRAATRMLGAIVVSYLATNVVNLIITAWEHVNIDSLRTLLDGRLYTFAADLSSLLTITCGAVRLPIYYTCNKDMRYELNKLIASALHCNQSPLSNPVEYSDAEKIPLPPSQIPPPPPNDSPLSYAHDADNNNIVNEHKRSLIGQPPPPVWEVLF